jgi:site-specific DNA-methyltransferase (adenine-specific)/adenine-specific DNA-methyltransferase
MNVNEYEIKDIIERLKKGENLPEDYKYKLFPAKQKEYELVYGGKMRREDILAKEDGVLPVPLQVERIFNGQRDHWKDDWRNIIVYGDNLQFLKTIFDDQDETIKSKVKGKVKLIYIDPPFGTEGDFEGNNGQSAYTDKAKDADFVEFIRRRLIVAKEVLADDGSIYVHLDWKKSHYIKVIMDEVFDENNFMNDIVWCYKRWTANSKNFQKVHDIILLYSKSSKPLFNQLFEEYTDSGKHFTESDEHGDYRWQYLNGKKYKLYKKDGVRMGDWWQIPYINSMSKERINYPTQKPELLLKRIIQASTNEGDLVLDFFGGSGTTAAVAEKLNRKWIVCDIGKLAFYTIQKRLLNIKSSKSLDKPKRQYGKEAKSFITLNIGQYDLEKIFKLELARYTEFVMTLFNITSNKKKIGGILFDGEKDGYYVLIWPYWDFSDSYIDEEYLTGLHNHIASKNIRRIYIIAPATYVGFLSDYYEIEKVKYYFLRVPYQVIQELHKEPFKNFRQPKSKDSINSLDDAVGFHFIRQPDVQSRIKVKDDTVQIILKEFHSHSLEDAGKGLDNFESLAMVLIDKNFNGNEFDMDNYYFADDLPVEDNKISLPVLSKSDCGGKIMVIYIDIYGNEFKEEFKIEA